MRFSRDCYRAHDPRWAFSPLSGAGAAIHGGRFNAKGTPALYLSLSIEGAVAEAAQAFAAKLEPLTICLYEVDCEAILDLTDARVRAEAGVAAEDMGCAWALDRAAGRVPPSWTIARRLMAEGVTGIVVPSYARHAPKGAANLVLWTWGANLPCRVTVHDPSGRLPKDQLSW